VCLFLLEFCWRFLVAFKNRDQTRMVATAPTLGSCLITTVVVHLVAHLGVSGRLVVVHGLGVESWPVNPLTL